MLRFHSSLRLSLQYLLEDQLFSSNRSIFFANVSYTHTFVVFPWNSNRKYTLEMFFVGMHIYAKWWLSPCVLSPEIAKGGVSSKSHSSTISGISIRPFTSKANVCVYVSQNVRRQMTANLKKLLSSLINFFKINVLNLFMFRKRFFNCT